VRGWDAEARNRPTMQGLGASCPWGCSHNELFTPELLVGLSPAVAVLAADEQEEREDASRCVVCMDAPRTHVLIPCGHLCVCAAHSESVYGFLLFSVAYFLQSTLFRPKQAFLSALSSRHHQPSSCVPVVASCLPALFAVFRAQPEETVLEQCFGADTTSSLEEHPGACVCSSALRM
jgi:hypothetical protein